MVDQFKYPEYKPYQTFPPEDTEWNPGDTDQGGSGFIERVKLLIDNLTDSIEGYREVASSRAVIVTGKDSNVTEALNGVWDEGTEIPLLIYEVTNNSVNTKHQFIARTVLDADRNVSGDYTLDTIDVLSMARNEAVRFLEFLMSSRTTDLPVECIISAVEAVQIQQGLVNGYSKINEQWFKASALSDAADRAKGIQKETHENLVKVNSALAFAKRAWVEIQRTSPTFYSETLPKLNTGLRLDNARMENIARERAALIQQSSRSVFQAISAGKSLKDTWREKSVASSVTARDIAYQAYISDNPTNLASATEALSKFKSEDGMSFMDTGQLFVRKQGYTHDDVLALVEMLNTLPETSTFIDAGIISVRAAYTFVEDLLQQINNMPENSTLISGGMIALIGKTLSEFQEEVERGDYGSATVQDVIDALNESAGGIGGLTILLPGVIGLTGSQDIREAIVDAINTLGPSSTLIGAGAVLVTGDYSLADKASAWDSELGYQGNLLSYFGITDSTLIDGGKISTSGVLVDYLLSGMTEVASDTFDISVGSYQNFTINASTSKRIREIRSYDSPNNWYVWPTACAPTTGSFRYKIQISCDATPDWNTAPYVRGTSTSWDSYYRRTYTDYNNNVKDIPLVLMLEGNYARYVRIHFGGFYNSEVAIPSQGDYHLATVFKAYGASAVIDGGQIFAQSIQIGSFDDEVTDILTNAQDTSSNFSSRNDRNSTTPKNPTLGASPISHTLNTDGTANVLFQWNFE